MSSESIEGVLPTAGMSVISGVVMCPSGRTCTLAPNSGLRQTKTVSSSSGPMTYSSPGPSCIATKEAGGSCGPCDESAQPDKARLARALPASRREKWSLGIGHVLECAKLPAGKLRPRAEGWQLSLGYRQKG